MAAILSRGRWVNLWIPITLGACLLSDWYCTNVMTLIMSPLVNSLSPWTFYCNFRHVTFKQILVIDGWGISCEIVLIWMSLDFDDVQSTLVQVMAWCHQATSHYLSQCWPRYLSPYGITRPQWVKCLSVLHLLKTLQGLELGLQVLYSIIYCTDATHLCWYSDNEVHWFNIETAESCFLENEFHILSVSTPGVNIFINSLWLGISTQLYRSGSTLAQIKVCCLIVPSYSLDQCWLRCSVTFT